MGVVVYITLLETEPFKTAEVQTEYLDYFTMNIQSFGLSSICVVCGIEETPPFEDSISVHCGFFRIFFLITDQLY